MKQTLHKKDVAWGSRLIVAALLLATVLVWLLASTPATAQSTDPLTGCSWAYAPECAHTQGFDTGNPSASPTASPTASASPTPTATPTASPTASAAQDQYQGRPDTDGKVVAPAETTEAKQLPNTGGLSETDRNSSMLPLLLGSSALLVGGGFLARRLIR